MSWQFACRSRPGSYYPVGCNAEFSAEEEQLGMEKMRVLHFSGIRRLACLAISACAELLVISDYLLPKLSFTLMSFIG